MKHNDALPIANWLIEQLSPECENGYCQIAGGLRRQKPDVHDLEIVVKPLLFKPHLEFGQKIIDKSVLDRRLRWLEEDCTLRRVLGDEKYRKYQFLRFADFGLPEPLNPFMLDLFIVTPPAQWGVLFTIRTGPGSKENNFSKWIVTSRSSGGCLPDGYKVKFGAVWTLDQLDEKDKPNDGENPIYMPDEHDFLDFLGLDWIEPNDRKAQWGRFI